MGEYLQLGDVKTWYEVDGEGDPLVLLYGGMSDGTTWSAQQPAFAERYHVFVPDRRGHGRTPDVDGPLTYDAMAEDTVAFLEQVIFESGGAIAATAARRQRVQRSPCPPNQPAATRPPSSVDGHIMHQTGSLDQLDRPGARTRG